MVGLVFGERCVAEASFALSGLMGLGCSITQGCSLGCHMSAFQADAARVLDLLIRFSNGDAFVPQFGAQYRQANVADCAATFCRNC
jgi:hypothetical protein